MTEPEQDRPWEELQELIEEAPSEQVDDFLDGLPAGETARTVSRLSEDEQARLLRILDPGDAADLVEQLPDAQSASIVGLLPPEDAAKIVAEMPSCEQADLLGDVTTEEAEAILAEMKPQAAGELRSLCQYPDDVAGGLMVTEYLAFPIDLTVNDVVRDLRENADKYADYEVQYAYVVHPTRELAGVLRMRDILLGKGSRPIQDLMIERPLRVLDQAPLDELRDFFERHPFLGVPVVDSSDHLVGIVHRSEVEKALADRSDSDHLKTQGIVGGEELRSMPTMLRSRRRLAWLSVNILLNVVAASIIAVYQDTLEQVIALAVFLPIISDMSGCSGNQAVAVSMRELTLGLIRPTEALRVWFKEVTVGTINGLALGALIASVAWLWKGNPVLGAVVGGAMALNTMIAVSIGGTVPLVLKRLGMDPALASGPILTTITDMCGFFLVLSLATFTLPYLVA